jgi:uncharacterized protein YukE
MKKLIDEKAIGIEVSWSFGDGNAESVTLNRQVVKNLFIEKGFGDLIEDVSPSDALVRAARLAPRVRDYKVVEFKRPNKDTPRSFGVYYVTTEEGESGDKFICGARVRIENDQAVYMYPEEGLENTSCMDIAAKMANTANKLSTQVINSDISSALLSIGHSQVFWISRRRNNGGVYYIPNGRLAESFVSLLRAIANLTSNELRGRQFIPQIVEQYPRPLTMETWEGAAQDDFEAKVDKLISDLTKMNDEGKMRESTINKRIDECDSIIDQAIEYRIFLKDKVEIISEQLKKIQTDFRKGLDENFKVGSIAFDEIDRMKSKLNGKSNRSFDSKPEVKPEKKSKKRRGRKMSASDIDKLFDF